MKKTYETPQVVVYGDIEKITQTGGGAFVDAAIGTPIATGSGPS
jgi:hypothetical protein